MLPHIKAINSATTQLQGRAAAAVNQALVLRNWLVGAYLVEFEQSGKDRANYGDRLLETVARDISAKGIRGLNIRILDRCRVLYRTYPALRSAISATASPKSLLTDLKPLDLESALLDHLQRFLLELGRGFCFEARQFRMIEGRKYHRVDLVFYHRLLPCHVLIHLKVRAFEPADAGQMNFYVNWFKTHMGTEGDNPPVGILLCSDKDGTEVELATAGMDQKLFVSRYLVALPSAEKLRAFLEAGRDQIELHIASAVPDQPRAPKSKTPTRKR